MIKPGTTLLASRLLAVGLAMAFAAGLSACGRKGPLEPHPADKRANAPAQSEDERSRKLRIGSSRKTLSSPISVPDRPFILDPLL